MEPKSCPLFMMTVMLASIMQTDQKLNPFNSTNSTAIAATKCIQTECAWYTEITEEDKYAASCSISWLGHQAILDAMLDRKIPNAESDQRKSS